MAELLHAMLFRRGKCAVCGGSAERHHTVTGPTATALWVAEAAWLATELRHKRCEQ